MQTQEQVVPIRTPESSFDDEVVTVIGPDGKVRAGADPKLPVEQVLDLYKAMVRTRIIDTQLERLQRQGRIGLWVMSGLAFAPGLDSAGRGGPQATGV